MERRLLLNIVVRKSTAILELFAGEDETLLVGRDTLLVLNLRLDIIDGVRGLNFESDGLASEGLHEDLHATAKAQHQVKGRLLLNVVVGEGTSVLELLPSEDETLLVGRDAGD